MIGRTRLFQSGVPIKFRVRRGIISAVKSFGIGFLFSVIRKRLAGNLPSAEAAAVRERGKENRVHCTLLLKEIKHGFGTFIHERNSSNLHADHFVSTA
jgi:hypothetical protein